MNKIKFYKMLSYKRDILDKDGRLCQNNSEVYIYDKNKYKRPLQYAFTANKPIDVYNALKDDCECYVNDDYKMTIKGSEASYYTKVDGKNIKKSVCYDWDKGCDGILYVDLDYFKECDEFPVEEFGIGLSKTMTDINLIDERRKEIHRKIRQWSLISPYCLALTVSPSGQYSPIFIRERIGDLVVDNKMKTIKDFTYYYELFEIEPEIRDIIKRCDSHAKSIHHKRHFNDIILCNENPSRIKPSCYSENPLEFNKQSSRINPSSGDDKGKSSFATLTAVQEMLATLTLRAVGILLDSFVYELSILIQDKDKVKGLVKMVKEMEKEGEEGKGIIFLFIYTRLQKVTFLVTGCSISKTSNKHTEFNDYEMGLINDIKVGERRNTINKLLYASTVTHSFSLEQVKERGYMINSMINDKLDNTDVEDICERVYTDTRDSVSVYGTGMKKGYTPGGTIELNKTIRNAIRRQCAIIMESQFYINTKKGKWLLPEQFDIKLPNGLVINSRTIFATMTISRGLDMKEFDYRVKIKGKTVAVKRMDVIDAILDELDNIDDNTPEDAVECVLTPEQYAGIDEGIKVGITCRILSVLRNTMMLCVKYGYRHPFFDNVWYNIRNMDTSELRLVYWYINKSLSLWEAKDESRTTS